MLPQQRTRQGLSRITRRMTGRRFLELDPQLALDHFELINVQGFCKVQRYMGCQPDMGLWRLHFDLECLGVLVWGRCFGEADSSWPFCRMNPFHNFLSGQWPTGQPANYIAYELIWLISSASNVSSLTPLIIHVNRIIHGTPKRHRDPLFRRNKGITGSPRHTEVPPPGAHPASLGSHALLLDHHQPPSCNGIFSADLFQQLKFW